MVLDINPAVSEFLDNKKTSQGKSLPLATGPLAFGVLQNAAQIVQRVQICLNG